MKVYLLDGTYELFRSFYGPPPRKAPDGREVGATIGLLQSLVALLSDPEVTHLACAFDRVIESFRNDLFAGYKTGEGIDPDLLAQFPLAEAAVAALGIVVWPMVEFEADDALATAALRFQQDPAVSQVVICSPDKDLAQLVSRGRIVCWDRRRNIVYDEPAVLEKYGVAPHTIPDWLALVGDAADGIPGVPAWGAKSAATVLSKYQHLEAIPAELENWEVTVRGARRLHESFMTHQEEAFLYRRLTRLRDDVPLTDTLDEFNVAGATKRFRPAMSRIGSERPSCASAFKRLSRKIDMRYALKIRPLSPADRDWATRHVAEHWGAEIVVAHGTIYHSAALPGFVAELDGKMIRIGHLQIPGTRARSSRWTACNRVGASARR